MQALRGVEAALHAHGAANRPTGVAERGLQAAPHAGLAHRDDTRRTVTPGQEPTDAVHHSEEGRP
ncbi:MAG: hypothetical protein RLZZ93_1109, partial [Actinomycetota bacterium]